MGDAKRGLLVIVAAPSGGGKTTVIRRAMAELSKAGRESHFSVSHTTRTPRPGEVEGRDYHFVSPEEFSRRVSSGDFLEHARVHAHRYGTSRSEVEGRLEVGCDVFLDIDVQGARQVRERVPESVLVFLLPPSFHEVRRRLLARGQDGDDQITLRMRNALMEMRQYPHFDCVIINDRLEDAVREFCTVLAASRLRPAFQAARAEAIIQDFRQHLEEE